MANDKANNFKRLASQRGTSVLKRIKLLANLGNKNAYVYTGEQVEKVFSPIEKALANAKARFSGVQEGEDEISL